MAQWLRKSLTLRQLKAAFERVANNHGLPGVDAQSVDDFANRLEERLRAIQTDVLGGRYQPQPLLRAWLPRPGKTPRPLGIPTVRDRTLHTALAMALTPVLEAEFEDCSYAYRQGRSVRMAVERIGQLERAGYRWVVEADIERFFDQIPHDRLLAELGALVTDTDLIDLVARIIATPVQDGHHCRPTHLGVPQGSPLSPLLANLYLDHLDDTLLDEDLALVRYADDFVVLTKTERRAHEALELTHQILDDLRLRLNPLKTRVVHINQGFEFLGWSFVRSVAVPRSSEPAAPPAQACAITTHPVQAGPASGSSDPDFESDIAHAMREAIAQQPAWRPSGADGNSSRDPQENQDTLDDASESVPMEKQTLEDINSTDRLSETAVDLDLHPTEIVELKNPQSESESHDESPEHNQLVARGRAQDAPPLQRTLYLTDPGVSLATENRHLQVRRADELVLDLPALNVDLVVLLGRIQVTAAAWVCCAQHGIPVTLLSRLGRFYGRFEPRAVARRGILAAQFIANQEGSLDLSLAREFVRGKLLNSALVLSRYARHRPTAPQNAPDAAHQALLSLRDYAHRTKTAPDLDTLRGLEGAGAAAYFSVWRTWFGEQWAFGARQQRTGADPINALLDLGYSLLYQASAGLIQARGLDPWVGHLHHGSAGHMALASDLMEEFRAVTIDSLVLDACLNAHLKPTDFSHSGDGYVLRKAQLRWFIGQFEQRLNLARRHPRTDEPLDMRRIMDAQVRALVHTYRHPKEPAYRACTFR